MECYRNSSVQHCGLASGRATIPADAFARSVFPSGFTVLLYARPKDDVTTQNSPLNGSYPSSPAPSSARTSALAASRRATTVRNVRSDPPLDENASNGQRVGRGETHGNRLVLDLGLVPPSEPHTQAEQAKSRF